MRGSGHAGVAEVDALVEALRAHATGRRIASLEFDEYGAYKTRDRDPRALAGCLLSDVRRCGKHVVIETDGPTLVVSFGRAGWARWFAGDEAVGSAPVIARLTFDDGEGLEFTDAGSWLSLGLSIVDEAADVPAIAGLGPDPSSPAFTADDLDRVLIGRRKQLRALLQEQESLAGIGGAYSDEILHVARLWPLAHASSLDSRQRSRLFTAVQDVLADAFESRRGVPIDRLKAEKVASMRVHGRTGRPCPVCGTTVADVPGSKGGAQYCPLCQAA